MNRLRLARLVTSVGLAVTSSCGDKSNSGPNPSGPTDLQITLKNVNVIPGLTIELSTAAGAPKAYRLAGGSSTQTDPITLTVGGANVQIVVSTDSDEELRVRAKIGTDQGTAKSRRRKGNTSGAKVELHVGDLDVRCIGDQWTSPDQAPASDCQTPVVLHDDFTSGSQWTETFTTTGSNPPTKSVSNPSTGGNPGGYRRMSHTLPATSSISVLHTYTGGTYDPAASGAIRYIHYYEDRIQFNPPFNGAAIGTTFRAFQGAGSYYVLLTNGAYTSTTWESVSLRRLTAASFSPANANFTATGTPISFGLYQCSYGRLA